jgi:Carboxypeptidase regulatory-like domain
MAGSPEVQSVDQAGAPSLPRRAFWKVSLSRVQAVVGLGAGILSILGAVSSVPTLWKPAPGTGDLVAFVQDAKSEQGVANAMIEVLTPQNAVVTTLTANNSGRVRHALHEGSYRLRVSHPQFGAEARPIQVIAGRTTEIRVRLRPGSSSPLDQAGRAVKEGMGSVRRVFGF